MTKYFGLIAINVIILLLIVFLQLIGYGTAPAITYNTSFKNNIDKKAACIEMTRTYNRTYIQEIVIGGLVLLVMNYFILKNRSSKYIFWSIILLLIYLSFTGLSLAYFSMNFIDRNMQMNW
jgi:hypothetical protein